MSGHDRIASLHNNIPRWTDIPTTSLYAELLRRQEEGEKPACGSKTRGHYNTPLHVAALIIILVLSTLACSFPIIVRRFPRLPVPHHFLFLSRHFGTGVLIATAFVHLLPTAFVSLTDPCLPAFWNEGYPAMPGFIAMVSVLIVVGVEMFFATRGAGHIHGSAYDTLEGEHQSHSRSAGNGPVRPVHRRGDSMRRFRGPDGRPPALGLGDARRSGEYLVAGRSPSTTELSPLPRKSVEDPAEGDEGDSDLDLDELDPMANDADNSGLLNGNASKRLEYDDPHMSSGRAPEEQPGVDQLTHQQQQKMLLQCLLLEAGILFHSVFIGMALSVAVGTAFIVLLVAISFHQTFEGLALGSRIAALHFPPSSPRPWLMALAYGTTTPIGQAIGLAIHNLYDPESQTGLLTVGTMNAISSGLLLFAGLVELLAEDFLSDESYQTLTGRRRLQACASVVAGALLMALVGAWA